MRIRDVGLVAAAFALFILGWIQDAPIVFNPYCSMLEDAPTGKNAPADHFRMPPKPIVVTVNQLLAAPTITRRRRFLITTGMQETSGHTVHFTELFGGDVLVGGFKSCARPNNWKGQSSDKVITMKGRVIGIQWGSIAPNNGTDTYSTTVVAVVTDEYTISVFTADGGKLLWQAEIAPEDHQAMEVNQASIAITSQRLYKTDEGMIVVAMPAVNSQKVPLTVYAAFNGKDGARHWRYLSDGGGLLDDLVAEAELLANPDTAIGGRDADLPKVRKIAPEKPAAKGETIEKEVEEDNDNEEEEEENEKEEVVVEGEKNEEEEPEENEEGPRQGEKLENTKDRNNVAAEAISAIEKKGSIAYISRKYEQSWSTYRQGVLSALPHHYDHPWDTSLDKHVFFRMKGRDSQTSPSTPYHAKAGGNLAFFYHNYTDGRSVVLRKNDEDYDVLGKQLASWQQSLRGQQQEQQGATTQEGSGPNTLVFHNKDGMEVIHLFTGDAMTRLLPLRSEGVFYDDVNDDDYIESIETMIGARLGKGTDEVVQSHEDCHGLIHTGVPLGGDELMRVTICDSVGYFGSFDILRYFLEGEMANDNSETDKPSTLLDRLELFGSRNVVTRDTASVTPIVVQTHARRLQHVTQVERLAVFMIDTGLLTCVDPLRRRVRWRAQTIAEFDPPSGAVTDGETGNKTPDAPENEEDQKDQRGDAYPHLTPYRPFGDRHGDNPIFARYARSYDYVIAVGQRHASVVGVRDGKVHQSIELPCTPIAPLLIEDINNDGVMDVIVTCKTGLYVYAGDMNGGAPQSVAVLILLVFFLVGLLFLVREVTVITKVEEAVDETERAEAARLRDMERRAFKRATD